MKMIIVIWMTACLPNYYRHVRDECSILEHNSISLMTLNHTTHFPSLFSGTIGFVFSGRGFVFPKKKGENKEDNILHTRFFNPGRGDELSPSPACINTIYPQEKTCTKLICYRGFRFNLFAAILELNHLKRLGLEGFICS